MRLGDLLGTKVVTESGKGLGRVYDVRAELGPRSLRVTGLCVGTSAFLERLGIGAPESSMRVRTHDTVPWSAVRSVGRGRVVVADGTEPR
jgi:sporulation protein YlmC with PRC-barrel domain